MQVISRRYTSLEGEVTEDNYEAGRYFVEGQELADILTNLERECFAFVADEGKPFRVEFKVEAETAATVQVAP
jgi:hypothetical protein